MEISKLTNALQSSKNKIFGNASDRWAGLRSPFDATIASYNDISKEFSLGHFNERFDFNV